MHSPERPTSDDRDDDDDFDLFASFGEDEYAIGLRKASVDLCVDEEAMNDEGAKDCTAVLVLLRTSADVAAVRNFMADCKRLGF